MKSLSVCGVMVACLTASASADSIVSAFETNDEGWTIVGDAQGGSVLPNWSSQGGNPDGHIWAVDDAVGGVWYFNAPAKFLGDRSGSYNRTLSFDLKQTYPGGTTPFDTWQGILRPDVALKGPGGLVIAYNFFDHPPLNAWKSYSVVLHESAGWRNQSTGLPATQEEMLTALTNLAALEIRGEYRVGPDTGFLDNVVLETTTCPADLDGNGSVGVGDLLILLASWGPCAAPCPADLDGSGTVGVADLLLLLAAWGPCPN